MANLAETETAVKPAEAEPAAPVAEPGLGPASPEVPVEAPEAVGSKETPVEGAEKEPASWWSAVANEEGLKSHEKVQPWLEEARVAAREEGRSTARQEMQPRVDARNQRLGQIQKELGSFWESFAGLAEAIKERSSEDAGEELKAFNDLLKTHQPALSALAATHKEAGYREAFLGRTYQNGDGQPVREMGVLEALFGDADAADVFAQRAQNAFEFGSRDESFYDDLREALTKTAVAAALAKEREKLDKDTRAQLEEEARAKDRDGKGKPAVPAGGGGGGGGGGYRTKAEARVLHRQDKITSAEMRRVDRDPSIPES